MRKPILIVVFLLSALTVEAKRFIYPIELLAGTADLIVVGEIQKLKGNSYTFKIRETLKGDAHESIAVKMFEEWECDRRFDKPEAGQRLCLFLKKGATRWTIINGGTGERLILNDSVNLANYSGLSPYRLSLTEFVNGIKEFCKCYDLVGEYELFGDKPTFRQLCTDEHAHAFKNTNQFSAWIFNRMSTYTIIRD